MLPDLPGQNIDGTMAFARSLSEAAPAVIFSGQAHQICRNRGSSTWEKELSEIQVLANGLMLLAPAQPTGQTAAGDGDGRKWQRLASIGPHATVAIVASDNAPPEGMVMVRIDVGKKKAQLCLAFASIAAVEAVSKLEAVVQSKSQPASNNGKGTGVAAAATVPLYKDQHCTLYPDKLVVQLYYFPFGNKTLKISEIRRA
jgi:hypothetical protein